MAINIKCPNCGNINIDSSKCRVCGQNLGDYPQEDFVCDYHNSYRPSADVPPRKKKHRKKKHNPNKTAGYMVIIVILSLCLAISAGVIVYLSKRNTVSSRRAEREYSTAKNDLIAENSSLKDKADALKEHNKALEEEKTVLEEEIASLKSEVDALTDKSDFMDEYIVVVNEDDGKKVYHKYGCTYFNDEEFWAYNNEQIRGKEGYTKCPHCIK